MVKRRRLVDEVLEQLQRTISLGTVSPGSRLPTEGELMVQLGVGRSTLREAVKVLAHAGLLEVRQGDGTYVRAKADPSEPLERRLRRAHIRDVFEVRRTLEIAIARLAAERRDAEDLDKLRQSLETREAHAHSHHDPDFIGADLAFHLAVAEASKNPVLVDLYRAFSRAVSEAMTNIVADPELRPDVSPHHRKLVAAISDSNATRAATVTAQYLDATARRLGGEQARVVKGSTVKI